jgi:hypothetical protein
MRPPPRAILVGLLLATTASAGPSRTSRPAAATKSASLARPRAADGNVLRSNATLLRGSKIAYHRLARAVAAHNDRLQSLRRFDDVTSESNRTSVGNLSTWDSRATYVAKYPDTHGVQRQNLDYYERLVRDADATLAALPAHLTGGLRLGAMWNNPGLRGGLARLASVKAAVEADGKATIAKQKAAMDAGEQKLIAQQDATFRAQQARLADRLATLPTERLFEHAMGLVGQIDAMASGKQIRRETVEQGRSSSSFAGSSSARGEAATFGVGGRLTGYAESSGSSSVSGASSSSYERAQLLLKASTYAVVVKTPAVVAVKAGEPFASFARPTGEQLTPVEARAMLGAVLEVHDVARALATRDPSRAAVLMDWLEHSTIQLHVADGGGRFADYKGHLNPPSVVQIGHAPRDIAALKGNGIVSEQLAETLLRGAVTKKVESRLDRGSALLDD